MAWVPIVGDEGQQGRPTEAHLRFGEDDRHGVVVVVFGRISHPDVEVVAIVAAVIGLLVVD
jgi:hypothetical protein